MARQSILVNLSPQIDIKSIHPPSFVDTTGNNSIFELAECISLVQSVPNETKLVINVISSQVCDIEDELADGILALLLSLETFINSFQFNWISLETEIVSARSTWLEVFPFINFVKCSSNGKSIQIPNIFGPSPLISPLNLNTNFFLRNLATASSSFKVVRKKQIKAFLSADPVLLLESTPVIPGKFPFNPEADGILFEIGFNDENTLRSALLFMDSTAKRISFVDPVYTKFAKDKFFIDPRDNSKPGITGTAPANLNNKWLDRSFSLSDWTNEESIDEDSLKKNNKLKLKKLILLSLRRMGIKKSDKQFLDIWKHLYCGCLFSLRKELSNWDIEHAVLLNTIRENIKFLNL